MKKVAAWGGSVVYLPDHVEACLKSLFHRTFWSRIWIFQEVLLAKTIEVSCGSKTMGWETLDLFHDILQRAQLGRTMKGNAESIFGSHALRLIQNRKSIQRLKPINMAVALAYLIEATTPMEATDQRDKVYALLGLSERLCLDCKASRLQADYEKTLHTIVTDVLCYLTEGEVFQHQINKFLVTRLLKESLGITTDDAYAAARASGTMTDEELKQLQTVIEAKGGHEVRKVLRAVSNSESRGAATLHERWMLRISTLRRDHIPTLDLTSLLEEDNYRRGTDRAILNQLPYRKGLLLDGHDRLPGEI
jgi:hypothetical protein